jgi:hypothetical protein
MDIPEPVWRDQLRQQIKARTASVTLTSERTILRLVDEYLADYFDQLVQAIVRSDLPTARALLKKHYPGSVERQLQIEQMLRGSLDGP